MWPQGLAVHSGNRSDTKVQNRVPSSDRSRSKYSFGLSKHNTSVLRIVEERQVTKAQRLFQCNELSENHENRVGSTCDLRGELEGGPGVKPGFAASDAAVLFGYTTHPFGTRAGNPTRISSLGPKRHHALDHASLINVEGMQRIEL